MLGGFLTYAARAGRVTLLGAVVVLLLYIVYVATVILGERWIRAAESGFLDDGVDDATLARQLLYGEDAMVNFSAYSNEDRDEFRGFSEARLPGLDVPQRAEGRVACVRYALEYVFSILRWATIPPCDGVSARTLASCAHK